MAVWKSKATACEDPQCHDEDASDIEQERGCAGLKVETFASAVSVSLNALGITLENQGKGVAGCSLLRGNSGLNGMH